MQDELEDTPPEKPDWKESLALARRRRWYFVLPLFLGWLIVWGVSWLVPAVYRSGTLILVEQPTVPQQYVVSNAGSDRLLSITQQILSRTRLLHVIDSLHLYPKESTRLGRDELVERMQKDIEIELVRSPERRDQLTSFNIYYSSNDPHVAQQVTSELTSFFISENIGARQEQSENTTQFLESQLEQARINLSGKQQRVREFKGHHLGELPGQLQSNLEILSGLHSQLQADQDALSHAKQQNVYLESLLGQYRSLESSAKTGEGASVGLPALDQELDKLKTQLADLGSHYTERHPDVRKLKEQIAKTERMKQQIAADLQARMSSSQPQNGASMAPHDYLELRQASAMMELQSQLKANQIEIANRQGSTKDLQGKISEYQARLNQTPVREEELADLTRDYDQSRADYEILLKRRNESALATNLEKRQQGEHFRVLDPPSLPAKPYKPNRFLLACMGLGVGLVLGGGMTAGAEFIDDRVYSEKELKKLVPVVLVDIPALASTEEERSQQRRLWLGWLSAGLMLTSIMAGLTLSYFRG